MIHTDFIQKNDESYRFYPNKKNDLYTIQKMDDSYRFYPKKKHDSYRFNPIQKNG
jgi:hypothetical protein